MRIVHCSDWHLDHRTHGVDRHDELARAVAKTVEVAIAEKVNAYVFTGDLCDPDSGSCVFRCIEVALRAAINLKAAGIPSIWISGNHDCLEDGSGDTTLSPLRAVADEEFIRVVERPEAFDFGNRSAWRRFVCFPFTATSHGYDPEKWAAEQMTPGAVTLSHLHVPGILPGEETTEMPRGREVVFPTKATKMASARLQGHFHRRQAFDPKDGGPPIQIPGSLARLTFNEEAHEPGFLLVDL